MVAIFAPLSGKVALAAKLEFKTYPQGFDYGEVLAKYYEKKIRLLTERFEK